METPSSIRRVTRSQAEAALSGSVRLSRKAEAASDKALSKSTQRKEAATTMAQDRSALVDITNDSPIIGLATGKTETPLSSVAKQRSNQCKKTPGSGEALLRGTVKTLLQKVEEAELSKVSFQGHGPFLGLRRCLNSPMGLLAPTPANTPQFSHERKDAMEGIDESPVEGQEMIDEKIDEMNGVVDSEAEKVMITRSLLFDDFPEKSEGSESSACSSVVTYQGRSAAEDDDSSVWSMQANASARDEDEYDEEVTEEVAEAADYYDEEEEEDAGDSLLVDALCEGMRKMSVKMGKHTRFVYNCDDELIGEKDDSEDAECDSSGVLHLKGLPTPKGKHVRFSAEEEEEMHEEHSVAGAAS
ncbi:hypothetical protein Droror1_Dr00022076 [Drosera rotundifolia]